MKKVITLLLTLLLSITLVGCNSVVEEEPVVQEEEVKEIIEDTPVLGGWKNVEDGTLNDDLKSVFNSALEGLLGANYEPIELLATQVVNGTNYKFLASGTKTTNPIIEGTYNIIVNKSSDGTISLVDIEVVEEKEIENDKEKDPSEYDYWVVFYDQYDIELQRTIEHYGSVPSYKGNLPEGFDNWTYKKTKETVNSFKPIVTNTYFKASCHEVKHNDEPAPDPEYVQVTCLTAPIYGNENYINTGVNYSDDMKFVFKAKLSNEWTGSVFGYYISYPIGVSFASYKKTGESGYEFYYGQHANVYNTGHTPGSTYTYEYQMKSNDVYLKIDNNTVFTDNANAVSVDTSKQLYLYTCMFNSGPGSTQPISIYYFKLYQNGSLVRDFIPVKTVKEIDKSKNVKDSSSNIPANTLCLYDKLNDKYYINFGTGSFTDTPIS